MFTSGFKPKSTTKKSKQIIRDEIRAYYSPSRKGCGRSSLSNMKMDADAYNGGWYGSRTAPDYVKGAALVDGGCFACYYNDQRKMLGKIYGKQAVDSWDSQKVHNTYKHLIGREYAAMLREQERKGEKR